MEKEIDLREALYNSCAIGPAWQIQLPREAVTSLRGLMVDLDANILIPNPWFPPADTAEAFFAGIAPVLERHSILRHAEIRYTGRWLHAVVWFQEPVELRSEADQKHWTGLHQVLMASVPSDPAAPALIGLTRPIGSINNKTGNTVSTIKSGTPITGRLLEEWASSVKERPFETIGLALFGQKRVSPCPYCRTAESHLDLCDNVGLCYGPCRRILMRRLHAPFLLKAASEKKQSPALLLG